jgi:hypothetical protein
MEVNANTHLTYADNIVLRNVANDINTKAHIDGGEMMACNDQAAMKVLTKISDEDSDKFQSSPFSSWDEEDLNTWFRVAIVRPYVNWAEGVVRRRADVVFLTHVGCYCITLIPSAVYLYYRFSWLHAACHWLLVIYYAGPFTLLLSVASSITAVRILKIEAVTVQVFGHFPPK